VAAIEQYSRRLLNDVARQLLGVDTVASAAGAPAG
jgi:hypothetical protein